MNTKQVAAETKIIETDVTPRYEEDKMLKVSTQAPVTSIKQSRSRIDKEPVKLVDEPVAPNTPKATK